MSFPSNSLLFSSPSLSSQDNPSPIDISHTLLSANRVLQVHREKIKRRGNVVTPLVTSSLPFVTTPSPVAAVSSPVATILSPVATISSPEVTVSPSDHTHNSSDGFDDIEEIQITSQKINSSESGVVSTPTEAFVSDISEQKGVTKNERTYHKRNSILPLGATPTNDGVPTPTELFISDTNTPSHSPSLVSPSPLSPSQEVIPSLSPSLVSPSPISSSQEVIIEKEMEREEREEKELENKKEEERDLTNKLKSEEMKEEKIVQTKKEKVIKKKKEEKRQETLLNYKREEEREEVSQEEILQHQLLVNQLRSSSNSRLVRVAPAPSNKRSSYHKHNNSKVGVENIVSIATKNSFHSNNDDITQTSESLGPSDIIQPIKTIHVLPIKTTSDNRGLTIVNKLTPTHTNDPATPTHTNDPAMPTHTNDPATPTHNHTNDSATPTHTNDPATPTHTNDPATPTHTNELLVEEIDDCEIQFDKPHPPSIKPHPLVTAKLRVTDIEDSEPVISAEPVVKNPVVSAEEPIKDPVVSVEESLIVSSEPVVNVEPVVSVEPAMKEPVMKMESDTAIPPGTPLMRDVSPLITKKKKKEKKSEEKEDNREERAEDEYSSMPLLRVKSTTSLYTPDESSTFVSKRKRATPIYSIHCSPDTVLPPPCPLYGTIQPTENELANQSLQQLRTSIRRKKSETQKEKENEKEKEKEKDRKIRKQSRGEERNLSPLSVINYSINKKEFDLSLHNAAREGNHRLVQSLLNKGYDVNGTDEEGCTPLMYCVLSSGSVQLPCADLLIRKGANIDQQAIDGSTVLHEGAIVGSVALIELLLLNGASIDVRDTDGRTPVHWSTGSQSVKGMLLLLKGSLYGIDVSDCAEMTPLMWACYNKNEMIAKQLIELGADLNEKDIDGKTAAHWAVIKCDINLLELVLTPDMTYFKDTSGRTVLHIAASEGFIRGIQLILSYRPDSINDTDKMGRTPLHYAAAVDRVDVCYLLLNKGSDVMQRDNQGKTPLDYGLIKEHEFVVALFSCHNTAIGDIAKHNRSSVSSGNSVSIINESVARTGLESIAISGNHDNGGINAQTGSYLGLFSDNQTPPLHYYFWITKGGKRKLAWSRSKNKQNIKEATVLYINKGPSQNIINRIDYSPNDLHMYVVSVFTEEYGVLDLLAYSESSYRYWCELLMSISKQNQELTQVKDGLPLSSTPVHNSTQTMCYIKNVI